MILNRASWHYRLWLTSFEDNYESPPATTDLCRYCHRVFWQIVAKVAYYSWMTLMIAMLAFIFGYGFVYRGLVKNTIIMLECTGAVLVIMGLFGAYAWWYSSKPSEPTTLAGQWLQARKRRICPIVEFENED